MILWLVPNQIACSPITDDNRTFRAESFQGPAPKVFSRSQTSIEATSQPERGSCRQFSQASPIPQVVRNRIKRPSLFLPPEITRLGLVRLRICHF